MGVIQCGSFSGNTTVTLGWEPQWMMIKRTDSTGDWITIDNMRGCSVGGIDAILFPNLSNAESVANDYIDFTPTGFISKNLTGTYIYTVIRRPMKTPTSGTEVYNAITHVISTGTLRTTGIAPDLIISSIRTAADGHVVSDRLRGFSNANSSTDSTVLYSQLNNAEGTTAPTQYEVWNNTFRDGGYVNNYSNVWHMFKRAKGFFDVVCYAGTGIARTVNHNLGVVPALMIVKSRALEQPWATYHSSFSVGQSVALNTTGVVAGAGYFDALPTSSVFSISAGSAVNNSTSTYVAYLFATLAGISKVGSYTGNGTSQTINCGFSTGARFILIKRTDATGDWYIWDTARGIVAANDPHLSLNTTSAEVTTDDSIDPHTSGFIVNQNTATNINVNGASYIFLAIA